MALATYADLQTQVANWLARDDLTSFIPDFVTLFEACANRRLRLRVMETSTSLVPASDGSVALPLDYLSWRSVVWTGQTRRTLSYVSPAYLEAAYPDLPVDVPSIFTIEGNTLQVMPLDSTAIDFDYYAKIPALSGTVNWLYTSHPDIYLFGTLTEANAFNIDPDKASLWKARRDELFGELDELDRMNTGSLAMRSVGPVV